MNVERLRREILRALYGASAFTSDLRDLRDALTPSGFDLTLDQLAAELAWLASVGCVLTAPALGRANVTLTERGVDVYKDRLALDGIARPAAPKSVMSLSAGLAAEHLKQR